MGGVFLISAAADLTSGADTIATSTQAEALATAVADCTSDSGGALRITSPADGATVKADPLVLHIANDTQDSVQTYVDGKLTSRNSSGSTLIALPSISPGSHSICVVAGNTLQTDWVAKDDIQIVVEAQSAVP